MATKAKRIIETNGEVTDQGTKSAEHLEGMEKAAKEAPRKVAVQIALPQLQLQTMAVRIVGDSPLIVHQFSEKAVKQILSKQMGEATAGREHKNPEEDYEQSLYRLPDGRCGFPTLAFKAAAVSACTSLGKAITKVAARQAFHVLGELAPIEGEPRMRRDMVRLSSGVSDVRFRGEFVEWATTLQIRFNTRVLSSSQIVNLLNTAGFAVGVGEWRPERGGNYGMFHCE